MGGEGRDASGNLVGAAKRGVGVVEKEDPPVGCQTVGDQAPEVVEAFIESGLDVNLKAGRDAPGAGEDEDHHVQLAVGVAGGRHIDSGAVAEVPTTTGE